MRPMVERTRVAVSSCALCSNAVEPDGVVC